MSVLLGATLVTGVGGLLLILFLSGVFGIAFAGLSFIAALLTKSEQAVSALSLLMFPVVFMSTAFVPAELMPGWMQSCQRVEPRHVPDRGDPRPDDRAATTGAPSAAALLADAIVGVVLLAVTLWAFRRLAD